MLTVRQILESKPTQEVCTIGPDASVFDAIQVFAEHNLGALIVLDKGALCGVVTERDYARKIVLKGRSSKNTQVNEIMSDKVIFVEPSATIQECMVLMLSRYIRHLPVLDDGFLAGIVSIGDVVRASLDEKEFLIDELVRYITDSPLTVQSQRQQRLDLQESVRHMSR